MSNPTRSKLFVKSLRLLVAAGLLVAACSNESMPDVEAVLGANALNAPSYEVIDLDTSGGRETATLVVGEVNVQQAKDAIADFVINSEADDVYVDTVRRRDAGVVICRYRAVRSVEIAQVRMGQAERTRWSCPDPGGG